MSIKVTNQKTLDLTANGRGYFRIHFHGQQSWMLRDWELTNGIYAPKVAYSRLQDAVARVLASDQGRAFLRPVLTDLFHYSPRVPVGPDIHLTHFNEGGDAVIYLVEVTVAGELRRFCLNVAQRPEDNSKLSQIRRDIVTSRRLKPKYMVKSSSASHCLVQVEADHQELALFAAEWLGAHIELDMYCSADDKVRGCEVFNSSGERRILLNHGTIVQNSYYIYNSAKENRIAQEMVKMLFYYFNPADGSRLSFMANRGDCTYYKYSLAADPHLQLITARRVADIKISPARPELLYGLFILNLTSYNEPSIFHQDVRDPGYERFRFFVFTPQDIYCGAKAFLQETQPRSWRKKLPLYLAGFGALAKQFLQQTGGLSQAEIRVRESRIITCWQQFALFLKQDKLSL